MKRAGLLWIAWGLDQNSNDVFPVLETTLQALYRLTVHSSLILGVGVAIGIDSFVAASFLREKRGEYGE